MEHKHVKNFLDVLRSRHRGDERLTERALQAIGRAIYLRLDKEEPTREVMSWPGPTDEYPNDLFFTALTPTRLLVWRGNLNHFYTDAGELRLNFTEWVLENTLVLESWSENYEEFELTLLDRITGERLQFPKAPGWNPYLPAIRNVIAVRRRRAEAFRSWQTRAAIVGVFTGALALALTRLLPVLRGLLRIWCP